MSAGPFGDPKAMTPQVRSAGHEGVKANMQEHVRALTEASGTVADSRRIVTFVYLLLRDVMPCGVMGEVMRYWHTIDAPRHKLLWSGLVIGELSEFADKLTDDIPAARVRDWLALVFKHAPNPELISPLFKLLGAADDIETVFTNGWLARYAQYVVKELQDG